MEWDGENPALAQDGRSVISGRNRGGLHKGVRETTAKDLQKARAFSTASPTPSLTLKFPFNH